MQDDNRKPELDAKQREIVSAATQPKAPLFVKGAVGSGKSLVAAEIALTYANTASVLYEKPNVRVISYTNALADYLRTLIGENALITTSTYHAAYSDFCLENGIEKPAFCDSRTIFKYPEIKDAIDKSGYSSEFLEEEIKWLYGADITSLEQYKKTQRFGRGAGTRVKKEAIWNFFLTYREVQKKNGKLDYSACGQFVLENTNPEGQYKKFTHIVVDEIQDFSINDIKAMVRMTEGQNSIAFLGDMAQAVYKRRFRWKDTGVVLPAKKFELTKNYRNTRQIILSADTLLQNEYQRREHPREEYTARELPEKEGVRPQICFFKNREDQLWFIRKKLKELGGNDGEKNIIIYRKNSSRSTLLADMGEKESGFEYITLVEDKKIARAVFSDVDNKAVQTLYLTTMHSAKGLEFSNVFIIDLNSDVFPVIGSEESREEDIDKERRLLYVAMTRAMKNLYLISSGEPTQFFAEIDPGTVIPVAMVPEYYEKLYGDQMNKLGEEKRRARKEFEKKIRRIAKLEAVAEEASESKIENETLKRKLEKAEEERKAVEEEREAIEKELRWITEGQKNYRQASGAQQADENREENRHIFSDRAKIFLFGGGNALKKKDLEGLLTSMGMSKDCYEWIPYERTNRYDITKIEFNHNYSDIIMGTTNHKTAEIGKENSPKAYVENHRDNFPKYQPITHERSGALEDFSKTKMRIALQNSALYARLRGLEA